MTHPRAGDVARLLRQRQEMGAPPLLLEGGTRDALLALLAGVRAGGAAPSSAPVERGGSARSAPRGGGVGAATSGPRGAPAPRPDATAAPLTAPREEADGAAELPADYDALREVALGCTRCALAATRTQVVFSDGPRDASVMVVGEAPGANEDATGVPFVGAAGKMLDLLLMSVDLSRAEDVYICNVLKCRPPGNRNPQPDEIACCTPYLRRQIALVRPRVILGVGTFAAQFLTGATTALGKLRGEVYRYEGVPVVVTYHPAALLRNGGWTRATWDDLQLLRQVLDG